MNVLGAAEGLARTRAELPFEEIGEGLLDDVAGLGEVTLANATDLNLRRAAVRIDPDSVDRRPHADTPARSSSSVMTAE